MTITPQNRMAEQQTRGRGRPPSSPLLATVPVAPNPEVPAPLKVLALTAPPCCGRAQDRAPKVERWRTLPDGVRVADCVCPMCGGRYVHAPEQARKK